MKLLTQFWKDTPGAGTDVEISEARLRKLMLTLAMILGPLLLFVVFYQATFSGLTDVNAMDFAQIGRNIAAGRGFTTYFLRPLVMSPGNLQHQPEVMHGPLYPFVLSLAFAAFGASDAVVAWVSGIFFLLTIPVLYLLCLRVFRRQVAIITTLIFTCSGAMLNYAVSGLHVTLYTFLTTCLLLTIYDLAAYARSHAQERDAPLPKAKLALVGVLAALLYLTDPIFFFALPVAAGAAIWLSPPRRRAQASVWVLVPLILMSLYAFWWNWKWTGNPIFGPRGIELWLGTPMYSSEAGYRLSHGDFIPGKAIFAAVLQKLLIKLGKYLQLGFSQFAASWVLVFFLPGLFFRFRDPAANLLRKVMLWILLAAVVGTVLFDIVVPLYIAVMPVMLAFAVAYLLHLVQQAQLSRSGTRLVAGLLGAAVLYPLFGGLFLAEKQPLSPEVRSARALKQKVAPDEVVLSDQPYLVAWYADRPSLWLPAQDERMQRLRERHSDVRWLFLTSMVDNFDPSKWNTQEWQSIYQAFLRANEALKAERDASGPSAQIQIPRIGIKADKNNPLSGLLTDFVWVAPSGKADSSVVMANAPAQAAEADPNAPSNLQPDPQPGPPAGDPAAGNTASTVPGK
ncbi:MAG TPA: glycosyltransferase family 39 protein [Chthonomonadaceae bacterium]|nr:glycosyltransferase family 39 protein [Chthonomonadaceae bacterium]